MAAAAWAVRFCHRFFSSLVDRVWQGGHRPGVDMFEGQTFQMPAPVPLVTVQHLDQALGDIPWMEGVMLSTKFTWRWLMSHGVSDLKQYKVYWKHKCKLHFAKYSNCNTQFNLTIPVWFPLLVPTVSSLTPPKVSPEGIGGLMPAQARCSLRNSSGSYLGLILHVFVLPVLVWPGQGWHSLFKEVGENH